MVSRVRHEFKNGHFWPISHTGFNIFFNKIENIFWDFIEDANRSIEDKFTNLRFVQSNSGYLFSGGLREVGERLQFLSDVYAIS